MPGRDLYYVRNINKSYIFGRRAKMLHLRSLMVLSLIFVITNIGTAVGSELITFSEYTEWTEITNQYANRGIIFGSDNNVPFIVTPLGETDPVLSGRPQYYGAIEGRFVDPNDGVTPMTVSSFSLDAGYFDQMGSTKIEWFGPNDHKLGEQTNSIIGYHHFEINGCYIARWRIAITGSEPYGYAVDNISFDFGPCGLNKIDNINNNNCVRESNEIIYTISYEIGPLGAANVMVVDRLADEVNYNSSAPQGDYNALDKTVTWNFGNLSPWASGSVELTVTVNGSAQPGQTIVNYAELESDNYNATAFEDTSVCSLPSNTIYVDIDANGANDGTSWDNAFVDFNDALEAAPNYLSEMGSCEIWVAEGTYKPDYEGTDYYSATFQMLEGNIAIRGHFGGVGVYETSPDQRDFNDSAYETILDGRVGPSGQKATYLVTCDDIGSGLILDGFTFTGAGFYGLYITNYSDPSIIRCKFNGNGYNGIRTEEYSYPDVADCLFLENGTAGIYSEHSSWPYVKNCIFDGNNHNSYGLQGLYSDMIVEKCVIKRQSVNGMYFSYSSVTVMDCNIENTQRGINCSNCQYIEVADSFLQKNNDAIYCSTSNLGVRGCIIQGNNISGITSLFASVPTITNNIIFNNRQYGVKLDNCENIDIKNNWIHHNGYGFPSDGSGLYFRYSNSPPLVRNNTIVGNAYFGIFVNLGMEPCLVNNIIRQNGINIYSERGLEDVNVSYCCIEGGFTGAGNIDRDPCFVDYDANNLHLQPV